MTRRRFNRFWLAVYSVLYRAADWVLTHPLDLPPSDPLRDELVRTPSSHASKGGAE